MKRTNAGAIIGDGTFQRRQFQVGIICALGLEAEMVEMILDDKQEYVDYGKAINDPNTYTTGTILGRPVVLAYCPGMGSNSAAQVASSLRSSFTAIEIILLVGICGVVPLYNGQEIMLGDCVISTGVVQFDLGRRGPNGFQHKQGLQGLGRPPPEIRSFTEKLQVHKAMLTENMIKYLQQPYPGRQHDRLYRSDYVHTHGKLCCYCDEKLGICNQSCEDLGCDNQYLQQRKRTDTLPMIHFGCYGSSNTVLKSGLDRDDLANNDMIAFEMEGSGVWEACPTIIIKSACDYADSHKNKRWQRYAAGVAAATTKAFLQEYKTSAPRSDENILVADAAIRNYYMSSNRLWIERLSGERLSLDECYVNLALIDKLNLAREESPSLSLETRLQQELISARELVKIEDLFESRKLSSGSLGCPRRIFIQGRAGVGKTTLCKKLVFEFLNKRLGSTLFDRLLWIPLRRLRTSEEYGWQDLIQDAHLLQNSQWKRVKELYADQFYSAPFLDRTLLLFDGLDELIKQDDRMFEFVESIICDSPNVIITSRPQTKSMNIGRFDLELETSGFVPDQIHAYVKNCISHPEMVADMMTFISMRPLIQGLLRIPIQLDAFCCTWASIGDREYKDSGSPKEDISTMTTLYHCVTYELCRKDIGRLQITSQPQKLTNIEINQTLQMELKFLGELAFQGLMNGTIEYSPKHIEKIASYAFRNGLRLSESYMSILDKLSFTRTSDIEQDHSRRNYHFLHLTFQEFFAARHFVEYWQDNTPLTILQLGASNQVKRMPPVEFLQFQKYNQRLIIFWRFVTGLIQIQSEELGKGVVTFFDNLDNNPIDTLGVIHRLLVMFCLSEVVISEQEDLQQLRLRKEHSLQEAVIEEYKYIHLQPELWLNVEFPENSWYFFLQDNRDIPLSVTLLGLMARPYISFKLLDTVVKLMNNGDLSMTARMFAMSVACRNITIGSKEMQVHISKTFRMMATEHSELLMDNQSAWPRSSTFALTVLKDEDEEMYAREVVLALASRTGTSNEKTINLLAKGFTNTQETQAMRYFYGRALLRPQGLQRLSHMIMTDLLAVIKDKDESLLMRSIAATILGGPKIPLPDEINTALLMLLLDKQNEDGILQGYAAKVLATQSSLPWWYMFALAESFEAEISADQPREVTMISVWNQILSRDHSIIRIIMLLPTKNYEDQVAPFKYYLMEEPNLSQKVINSLLITLKEETGAALECAIEILASRSSLSQQVLDALVVMLEDQDSKIRNCASSVLSRQTTLPRRSIESLAVLLEHKDYDIRYHAIVILASQLSLSRDIIPTIVSMMKNKDQSVRRKMMHVLQNKSDLPQEILSMLLIIIRDVNPWGTSFDIGSEYWIAAMLLAKQLYLPQDTVVNLLSNAVRLPFRNGRLLVYDLLSKHAVSSVIRSLDIEAWKNLYYFWLWVTHYGQVNQYDPFVSCSCFRLNECLSAYWNEKMVEVSSDSKRTQALMQGMADARRRYYQRQTDQHRLNWRLLQMFGIIT